MGSEDASSSHAQQREAEIRALVTQVIAVAEGADSSALRQAPQPTEWSAMEVLAHIAEFVRYWADQAVKVATQPGTTFGRTQEDPDRIAAVAEHGRDQLNEAVRALYAAEDHAARCLNALAEGAWTARGVHPIRGDMTVEQIVEEFIVHHLGAHLEQLQTAGP